MGVVYTLLVHRLIKRMANVPITHLSKRERQIMDLVYAKGEATVREIQTALPDPPSYSAVRAQMRILEEKGHLAHRREGVRYVYLPTKPHGKAGRAALERVLHTFYSGDVKQAVTALLDVSESRWSREELRRLMHLIKKASRDGR